MKKALVLALVSLGVLCDRAMSLPAGYQAVAYIQSTGTQYINPDLTVGNSTSLELKLTTSTQTSGNYAFFGRGWSNSEYLLTFQNGSFKFYGDGSAICAIAANTDYTVTASNTTVSVVNESTPATNSVTGKTFGGGSGWNLFAASGGGNKSSYKLRSMNIWEAGVLVRDFHPCYTNTANGEVIGLYDTVNAKFYVNAGTGAFLRGQETENYLWVRGAPDECGTPVCGSLTGYGGRPVTNGMEVAASVPVVTGETATVKYELAGWTLTIRHGDGSSTVTQNGAEHVAECTFTPAAGDLATLEWQWNVQYKIAVAADPGLDASASVLWADIGDTVTISATEDTAPFLAWEGDVPAANKFDLSFSTTVTSPMTFTAKTPNKIYYVAPGGTGDGTSWAAAFGTIQAAVTAGSTTNNVLVCVKEGGFLQTSAVTATGVGPLMIRGGYAGVGFTMGGATVVGRQTMNGGTLVQCTLFSFSGSTVSLESMTITNGFSRTVYYGQAVSLLNTCTAKIKNCKFTENGFGGQNDAEYYGGAVGAQNGTLVIDGCAFTRNRINGYGGNSNNTRPRGGAVGANAAAVTIRDSTFDGNWTQHIHTRALGGGALGFVNCTSLDLVRCNFTTNYARRNAGTDNHSGHVDGPYGGTLMVMGATKVSIADCTFIGSWNNSAYDAYPYHLWGGTIYLRGATTAMSRCIVYNTGDSGGMTTYNRGGIDILGGELYMTNVLHAFAYGGNALGNSEPYGGYTGGKIEAVNCTFAGGRGIGNQTKAVYFQAAGSATFRNCIFWNNAGADVDVVNGDAPVFEYCITSTAHDGPRNSTADPLLADTRYCHPRSQAGRYNGGWFTGGAWVTNDTATSASIDAGDAAVPYANEPQPHLYQVNIGYDGGTPTASKSIAGTDPVPSEDALGIYAYEATAITANGATVSADVNSTGGGANPTVTVAWGPEDGGTTLTDWPNKLELGTFAPWNPASYEITGITGYSNVCYRFFATNAVGTATSDPVKSFMLAVPPTIVYDTDENPVSHHYRTSARLHATLSSNGRAPTTVHAVWWPTAEPADVTTNAANYGLAVDSGAGVAVELAGLAPGAAYSYFIEAVNGAGTATLATKSFSTVSEAVPLVLYAGPEPVGRGDGCAVASAAGDIQMLIDAAYLNGDEIRMLAGTNTLTKSLTVTAHPGLAIRGGYTGTGDDRSGETIILRPEGTRAFRIFVVTSSTITFDKLTITDGKYSYPNVLYGQGIALLSTCDATVTNCTFLRNGVGVNNGSDQPTYGGAIGAQNGTLRVYDSRFEGNCVQGGTGNVKGLGGAIGMTGATGSSADIRRCSFTANFTQAVHSRDYGGGALGFRSVPAVNIEGCTFRTNFCRQASGTGSHTGQPYPHGGTIYLYNAAKTTISDCTILGSWSSQYLTASYYGFGGTMWLESSAVAMNRVAVYGAGYNAYSSSTDVGKYVSGSIDVSGGSLCMTNVLHGAAYSGPILCNLNNGQIEAVNCTFAGARGMRTKPGIGYVQIEGSATFRNCILWNNAGGDFQYVDGTQPVFNYCITSAERDGMGNSTNNPQFAESVYFHPQSRAGRYDGGWFANGAWVTNDTATSPAIDAGDPAMGYGAEPQPNLRRVNMGYDGGTAAASKSDCGTDPVVTEDKLMVLAYAATAITDIGATVSADVASTGGGADPDVTVVWDGSDKGTNSVAAWGGNLSLGTYAPWNLASYTITDASALTDVFFRFVVENEKGVSWSDPVKHFKIARKPTIAYPAEEDVVTHLYRTYARVHANLVSDGGSDATVRLVYWPITDAAAVVTNVANDGLACPAGAYAFAAGNLAENTEYAYFIEAENNVGVARLAQKTFKTKADAEKLTLVGGPANVGHGDGASFAHPSGELQMLLDALYMGGDEILLMQGTNIVADALIVNNHPGLTIRGGYTADGASRNGESVLRRDSSLPKVHRIFTVTASTVVFDQVTVAEGQFNEYSNCYGMGVGLLSACNATFTNCLFRSNGSGNTTDRVMFGSAIGAKNGTLTIVDCVFTNNSLHGGGGNVYACGGAVGAEGATVRITGSTFSYNWTQTIHARYYGGGALGFLSCPSVIIDHCTFATNYTHPGSSTGYYTPQKDHGPYGGTIYLNGASTVAVISDCTVLGGWNASWNSDTPTWGWGGTMFFRGGAKVALVRTKILGAGLSGSWYTAAPSYCSGSIDVRDAGTTLAMTNVLHAGAVKGPCLGNNGGTINAVNCTFVDTKGGGSQPNSAYVQYGTGSTTTFRNCIVWDNAGGFLYSGNQGDAPSAMFSDLQGTEPDEANHVISADPKFEDAATLDYRLGNDSPCVNAGDRTGILKTEVDLGGERRISGANIDLGAYEYQQNGLLILLR